MIPVALTVDERVQTLGICPVFSGVPPSDLRVLAEMMETEHLAAGEVLFERDDPSDRIFVIARGRLSVSVAGRSKAVRELGPGELLGEYGMFSGLVRTATIEAQADAVVLSLPYPRFRAFLLQFPESALILLATTVGRLVEQEKKTNDRANSCSA